MSEMLKDHSEARRRTMLSWQRTALGLVAVSALTIKFATFTFNWFVVLASISALIGAAGLYVISEKRKYSHGTPFIALSVSAGVVALLAIICLLSFL